MNSVLNLQLQLSVQHRERDMHTRFLVFKMKKYPGNYHIIKQRECFNDVTIMNNLRRSQNKWTGGFCVFCGDKETLKSKAY